LRIIKSKTFNIQLVTALQFIAQNNPLNAKAFKSELDASIFDLPNFPFKFRESEYYDDINARDLIFKGYTIPYYVDSVGDTIIILKIFKYRLP
jgi:toxin ParE1/3/4